MAKILNAVIPPTSYVDGDARVVIPENLKNQKDICLYAEVAMGDSTEILMNVEFSNPDDTDGSDLWFSQTSDVPYPDNSSGHIKKQTEEIAFQASGNYRFKVTKAMREDRVRISVRQDGSKGTISLSYAKDVYTA